MDDLIITPASAGPWVSQTAFSNKSLVASAVLRRSRSALSFGQESPREILGFREKNKCHGNLVVGFLKGTYTVATWWYGEKTERFQTQIFRPILRELTLNFKGLENLMASSWEKKKSNGVYPSCHTIFKGWFLPKRWGGSCWWYWSKVYLSEAYSLWFPAWMGVLIPSKMNWLYCGVSHEQILPQCQHERKQRQETCWDGYLWQIRHILNID